MHLLGAAPLNVKAAAAVETEFVFQPFIGQVGDQDASRLAERFQAAGDVDGVAPKVVGELPAPDHAGDDGAGADANAELDGGVVSAVELLDICHQVEGQFRNGLGMVGAWQRNATGKPARYALPGSANPTCFANCRQTRAQPRECSQNTTGSTAI